MPNKHTLINAQQALPGRTDALSVSGRHYVNQTSYTEIPAAHHQQLLVGMGCFWGAERLFWQLDGVHTTSVGYAGGYTENPTYQEVCSGQTGHAEVVQITFDPAKIALSEILKQFWQSHDPTQGMQQGNDIGSQYRSMIFTYSDEQARFAKKSKAQYQELLQAEGRPTISTEIVPVSQYYFAEEYHQQYLAKNPQGYCGIGGTGVCFPPE